VSGLGGVSGFDPGWPGAALYFLTWMAVARDYVLGLWRLLIKRSPEPA